MSDRRAAKRLIVPSESLERLTPPSPDSLEDPAEERTQPMRLSFLALLAERDPLVQARLNLRRRMALEAEAEAEDDRPTDPMMETDKG